MGIIAGISFGKDKKEPDHCGNCGIKLPKYWGEDSAQYNVFRVRE